VYGKEKSLFIDDKEYHCDNPYYALRDVIPTDVLSVNYAGGLVGFICYEGMNYFEPSLKLETHKDFNTFHFGVYLDGIILDKMTGEVFYFYYEKNRIEQINEIIQQDNISDKSYKTTIEFTGYTFSEEEHKQKVAEVLEEVKAGNTFQCQIGLKAEYKITGDTLPIYMELRHVNPSPHMYYVKFGDKKLSVQALNYYLDYEMEKWKRFRLPAPLNADYPQRKTLNLLAHFSMIQKKLQSTIC
jgi:anthranilate synthase component 1